MKRYVLPVVLFLLISANAGAYTWVGAQAGKSHGSPTEVYNVKDYGAVGDGSTDDTAALKAAYLAACQATLTVSGSTVTPSVYLPKGIYKTTSPFVKLCATGSPPALVGSGYNQSKIYGVFSGPVIMDMNQSENAPASENMSVGTNIISGCSSNCGLPLVYSASAAGVIDLNQVLAPTGANSNRGPFDAQAAFDVRFFFRDDDTTANRCIWVSDGGVNTITASGLRLAGGSPAWTATTSLQNTGALGYFCVDSTAKVRAALNINGTQSLINSGATTVTQGTVYEGELSYDGANLNLYLGTGGTTTRVAQNTGLSGNITQRYDEHNWMGMSPGTPAWPRDAAAYLWQGAIQSFQISNTARHTAASYGEDTAPFASDANTLFLFTGTGTLFPTVNSKGTPVIQVEKGNLGSGPWYIGIHNVGWGCCGGVAINHDFDILGGTVGHLANAIQVDMENVGNESNGYVGFDSTNNSTFSSIYRNIPVANGQLAGFRAIGGATLSHVTAGAALESFIIGGSTLEHALTVQTDARTQCGVFAFDDLAGTAVNGPQLSDIQFDSENGGSFNTVCVRSEHPVSIQNSILASLGKAPVALFGPTHDVRLANNGLTIDTGGGVTLVVDATYASATPLQGPPKDGASVTFDNNSYNQGTALPAGVNYTNNGVLANVTNNRPILSAQKVSVRPSYVALGSNQAACSNPSCTGTIPSNAAVGDGVIAMIQIGGGGASAIGCPATWSSPASCTLDNHAGGLRGLKACGHIIAPGETTTPTFTVSADTGTITIVDVGLVNGLSPIEQCFTATNNGGVTSFSLTGGTSGDKNDLILPFTMTQFTTDGGAITLPTGGMIVSGFSYAAYYPASTTVPAVAYTSKVATNWTGMQIAIPPALSADNAMTQNSGASPIMAFQSGAPFASIRIPPGTLASFGTCSATTEGSYGTQTDSAVACVAGVNAAAGGTTHCQMYCNGTNWVRTGL